MKIINCRFTSIIAASFLLPSLHASDYISTLDRIVSSSPYASAATASAEAEKKVNKTGLTLENPEVEFSYQWGDPSRIVLDKKTLDVSQTFDFATLSGGKRRLSEARTMEADAKLAAELREVRVKADAIMTHIVFCNRMAKYYEQADSLYDRLVAASAAAVKLGQMTIVDLNSAKMAHNAIQTEANMNLIELRSLRAQLSAMAGGSQIDWNGEEYMPYYLPGNIRQHIEQTADVNPEVATARAVTESAEREVSLRKSEGLPDFSLGYTSEMVKGANYYGVSVGIALPLWGNKGRVAAAKANRLAAEIREETVLTEYAMQRQRDYEKARALLALDYENRKLRDECDISELLAKMFAAGNLSVHDYLTQMQPLLELDRRVIETEYEYQQALSDFRAGE